MTDTTTERAKIDVEAGGEYQPDLYHAKQVVESVHGIDAVSDELIAQYHELGFLAIDDVFTDEQVAGAYQALTDLIMGRVKDFEGVQFESAAAAKLDQLSLEQRELAVRKLMWFVPWHTKLRAMAEHAPLMALVRRLLGDREPKMFQDMALLKPPGGREKPWHQDKAYFDIAPDEPVVGVWIALDDATVANGCMHVAPGSHRQGAVVHFKRRDWQICDAQVRRDQVASPLHSGGALLFDGFLHHGTPANRTEQRRRALQFHYAPADAVWTDTGARLAVFGEEGKDVTC